MRLAHVRATTLSLLAGGFLIVSMLAAWSGIAQAGSVSSATATASASPGTATASASPGTTTVSANTDTTCQLLPSSSTPSPSP